MRSISLVYKSMPSLALPMTCASLMFLMQVCWKGDYRFYRQNYCAVFLVKTLDSYRQNIWDLPAMSQASSSRRSSNLTRRGLTEIQSNFQLSLLLLGDFPSQIILSYHLKRPRPFLGLTNLNIPLFFTPRKRPRDR